MENENPINLRQDRRQWLKTSATMLGATLLPMPAIAGEAPQTEGAKPAASAGKPEGVKATGHFFTPEQHAMVEELSETILPADSHSGGAKAAKVADYIDQALHASVEDDEKALWREGLRLVDAMSRHYHGKSIVESSPEERIAVLTVLSDNQSMSDLPEVRFFHALKSMTVTGYYTSKIGIHDELEYKGNRILMEYVGCGDPTPGD
jgi:hypothetical protein